MIAVLIILLVLFLLAMIWLAVEVRFSDSGLLVFANVVFVKIQVYPMKKRKKTKKSDEKPKKPEKAEKKDKKSKKSSKKTANKPDIKAIIKMAIKAADRLRRKLVIKNLILHYTVAGDDPCDTAMQYGKISAAVGAVLPIICSVFNVKNRDIEISVSFDIPKPVLEFSMEIGGFLWQILFVGGATLIDYLKLSKTNKAAE